MDPEDVRRRRLSHLQAINQSTVDGTVIKTDEANSMAVSNENSETNITIEQVQPNNAAEAAPALANSTFSTVMQTIMSQGSYGAQNSYPANNGPGPVLLCFPNLQLDCLLKLMTSGNTPVSNALPSSSVVEVPEMPLKTNGLESSGQSTQSGPSTQPASTEPTHTRMMKTLCGTSQRIRSDKSKKKNSEDQDFGSDDLAWMNVGFMASRNEETSNDSPGSTFHLSADDDFMESASENDPLNISLQRDIPSDSHTSYCKGTLKSSERQTLPWHNSLPSHTSTSSNRAMFKSSSSECCLDSGKYAKPRSPARRQVTTSAKKYTPESDDDENDSVFVSKKRKVGCPKGSKNKSKTNTKESETGPVLCGICKEGGRMVATECGHIFREKCLQTWFKKTKEDELFFKKCPMCSQYFEKWCKLFL